MLNPETEITDLIKDHKLYSANCISASLKTQSNNQGFILSYFDGEKTVIQKLSNTNDALQTVLKQHGDIDIWQLNDEQGNIRYYFLNNHDELQTTSDPKSLDQKFLKDLPSSYYGFVMKEVTSQKTQHRVLGQYNWRWALSGTERFESSGLDVFVDGAKQTKAAYNKTFAAVGLGVAGVLIGAGVAARQYSFSEQSDTLNADPTTAPPSMHIDAFSPCMAALAVGGVASASVSNPFPLLLPALACLSEVEAAAPIVANPVGNLAIAQNSTLDLTLYSNNIFTDADGDFLNVTVSGAGGGALPSWMTASTITNFGPELSVFLGAYDTSSARRVAVVGSTAYVADEGAGIKIIDVSAPNSPSLLGAHGTSGSADAVAVEGSTVYVADGVGLQIIDVSTPSSPILLGAYNTPDEARGVAVVGNTAYVADKNSGLLIIDVTTPSSPSLLASYIPMSNPYIARVYAVAVVDNTAYVSVHQSGQPRLEIIDVTTPSNPSLLGSYNTLEAAYAVTVVDSTAYLAEKHSGLQIIDVTTPSSPSLLGSYTPYASEVAVVGNTAYVADVYVGRLHIIDVTTPSNPMLLSIYNTPDQVVGVAAIGSTVYIAAGFSGLQIIEDLAVGDTKITLSGMPTVLGIYPTEIEAGDGTGNFVMDSFNITVDALPVLVNNTLSITEGESVVFSGSELSATDVDTDDATLRFFVSNILSGQFEFLSNPGIAITDFFQANVTNGAVQIVHDGGETAGYDVSVSDGVGSTSPQSALVFFTNINDLPSIVSAIPAQSRGVDIPYYLDISGHFSDAENDPLIFNSTLATGELPPTFLSFNETLGVYSGTAALSDAANYNIDVSAYDGIGYTSQSFTLDILRPEDVCLEGGIIGSYVAGGGNNVADFVISGNRAFVAAEGSGLHIIDISTNPTTPSAIAIIDTPYSAYKVAVNEDATRAYVLDYETTTTNGPFNSNTSVNFPSIQIIDTASATIIGRLNLGDSVNAFSLGFNVLGNTLYLWDYSFSGKIKIYDTLNPSSITLLNSYQPSITIETDDLYIGFQPYANGQYALLTTPYEIQSLSLSDPTNPEFLGAYPAPSRSRFGYAPAITDLPTPTAVVGVRKGILGGADFHLVAIHDPSNMFLQGIYDPGVRRPPISSVGISDTGDKAYVLTVDRITLNHGMHVFNMTDVESPNQIKIDASRLYSEDYWRETLAVHNNLAYMIDGPKLKVFNPQPIFRNKFIFPGKKFSYSIPSFAPIQNYTLDEATSTWINLDEQTGEVSGRPSWRDFGSHSITMYAYQTSSSGTTCQQINFSIRVLNIPGLAGLITAMSAAAFGLQWYKSESHQRKRLDNKIETSKDINKQSLWNKNSLLHEAAAKNDVETGRRIIQEKHAAIALRSRPGDTPLHVAAKHGHSEFASMLIEKGTKVHALNNKGLSPLHLAVIKNDIEMVTVLLSKDGPIDALSEHDGTPLAIAARLGHINLLNLLLEHKADPNIRFRYVTGHAWHYKETVKNASALFVAIKHKKMECAERLLAAGANKLINEPLNILVQTPTFPDDANDSWTKSTTFSCSLLKYAISPKSTSIKHNVYKINSFINSFCIVGVWIFPAICENAR